MNVEVQHGLHLPRLENFEICTLTIKSEVLKRNRLNDPYLRDHGMLIPNKKSKSKRGFPVVFVLAGFSGNGPNYFGLKSFDENFPQTIDSCFSDGKAPHAVYIFIDAFTKVGGSQFIDSEATGNYESHIMEEVVAAVKSDDDISVDPKDWCVMGGSSGGYGALHLASKYPEIFGLAGAIAPDAFFEACYLSDIYASAQRIQELGGYPGVLELIESGELTKQRKWHDLINAVGMAACYSPKRGGRDVEIPVDFEDGRLNSKIWKKWKDKDPVEFLLKRRKNLEKLRGVFLEVGTRDEFNLLYGARQIREILQENGVRLSYNEYRGGHFDLSKRRPFFLKWLNTKFRV